jgi:DNA-binding NtrC family response regulator
MTRHALVVDDDKLLARTLADILRMRGWEVTTAHTGAEAVNAAARDAFDVVLMDIRMPEMDGVAAFKAMKEVKPDVRVVLMTAYADESLISDAQRSGVLRILSKPVDMRALLALIDAQTSGKPVLVMDEDAEFLKTLSDVLALRGYRAVVASSIEDAARVIQTEKPKAVLLHLNPGKQSARETVRAVHELNPSIALVLYSGQPAADAAIDVPPEWVTAYLQKPFAIDELAGVLNGDNDR